MGNQSLGSPESYLLIDNTSDRPDAELKPLVRFVAEHSYHHKLARVHVKRGPLRDFSRGYAWKFHTHGQPSLVTIHISRELTYPYTSLYRVSAGPAVVHSWQEEFLFVLAHEMRHIDQFWSVIGHHPHVEVDAERFAIQVLGAYQSKIRKCHVRVPVDIGYPRAAGY